MDILNLISLSAVILYIIPVILYVITQNIEHLKAVIGLFVTMGVGESIKYYIIGNDSPRPTSARDCNLLCNDGPQGGKPGMPSGHSAQVAFFSSFYFERTNNIWIKMGLILYECLVMFSRYKKHCHTIPQIVSGALLGFGISKCVS
jgi:membrane-associated phospholipid phosphatase